MKPVTARREFLRQAGLSVGAIAGGSAIYDLLLGEILQRAMASSAPLGTIPLSKSNNYLHFTLPGGPPRWMFDLPLAPNGVDSTFTPGTFGTGFEIVNGQVMPKYLVNKTSMGGGKFAYLPPVWASGAKLGQDFSSLLPNTVFVRGMDMEINSHPLSNLRQISPLIGNYSINGVVADNSTTPVPGITDSGSPAAIAFKSMKGFSASGLDYTTNKTVNPLSTLLKPFANYTAGRKIHSASNSATESGVLASFEKFAKLQGVSNNAVSDMYDSAMEMIAQNVTAMSSQWASVFAKYQNLIAAAILPSYNDMPEILGTPIAAISHDLRFSTAGGLVTSADVRTMVDPGVNLGNMAANFAISEVFLGRLTSTFCLGFSGPSNIPMGNGKKGSFYHDQHALGYIPSTIMTTIFYRAFLSCLTEFVTQLKANGTFAKTMIHITADFNRNPRTDGSGSDHGYNGSNATLISGLIAQGSVIGNVVQFDGNAGYQGTWGVGAAYLLDNFVRPIQVNDVAKTITMMLGASNITTNGMVLLGPNAAGGWATRLNQANNV